MMALWLYLGITSPSFAQENEDLSERQTVFSMGEVQEVLDQIALGVVLSADVNLMFDRSDNSYLTPLSQYLETNLISQEKSATLYPKKMVTFILGQLNGQLTLKQISELLVDAYKQQEIAVLKSESEQIKELRLQDAKTNLDELDKDYDMLIRSIEGLIANGAKISLGTVRLDWSLTPIPQLLERIREKKERLARKAAQALEKKKAGGNR